MAARQVLDAIERLREDLVRQNKELHQVIDAHTPQGSAAAVGLALLSAVPATIQGGAHLSALFKTDVSAQGIAYGDGARRMFATLLSHRCPDKLAGLGSGYLGELDGKQYATLLARVRALAAQRGELAQRIATLDRLADAVRGDEKRGLAALVLGTGALLKTVDAFIDSLRAGETGDRSPLFNAARYLGYAARTEGMLVLDFDLRLAGMTIVTNALFTGQKLHLSGVGFSGTGCMSRMRPCGWRMRCAGFRGLLKSIYGSMRRTATFSAEGNHRSSLTTFCSIAPKIDLPLSSSISMRIVSPKRMNCVTGWPNSIVSRQRCSAMQE